MSDENLDRGKLLKDISEMDFTEKDPVNHLLVIGIDQYEHCGKLNNAVSDAQEFVKILLEYYQFEEEHLISLYDLDATYEAIEDALKKLLKVVEKGDNLVIYFAGHGYYNDIFKNRLSWVPVEAKYNDPKGFFRFTDLIEIISQIQTCHTLIIADSCYSGAGFYKGKDRNIDSYPIEKREKRASRYFFASGGNEVVKDGEAGKGSPFSRELIHQLDNHKYLEEGISVAMLVELVTVATSINNPQSPKGEALNNVGHKGGMFVFRPKEFNRILHISLESFHRSISVTNTDFEIIDSSIKNLDKKTSYTLKKIYTYNLIDFTKEILNKEPHFIHISCGSTEITELLSYKENYIKIILSLCRIYEGDIKGVFLNFKGSDPIVTKLSEFVQYIIYPKINSKKSNEQEFLKEFYDILLSEKNLKQGYSKVYKTIFQDQKKWGNIFCIQENTKIKKANSKHKKAPIDTKIMFMAFFSQLIQDEDKRKFKVWDEHHQKEHQKIRLGFFSSKYSTKFALSDFGLANRKGREILNSISEESPNIVHFSGTGLDALCRFNGEKLEINALDRLFGIYGKNERYSFNITCVILLSCYDYEQAQAIHKHVDWVIGINPIKPEFHLDFTDIFYCALGAGKDIEFAYKLAIDTALINGYDPGEHKLFKPSSEITPSPPQPSPDTSP